MFQLYDENCNPVFIYEYCEGEYNIHLQVFFKSNKELSLKEIEQAYEDYKIYKENFLNNDLKTKGWYQERWSFLKEKLGLEEMEFNSL